MSYHMSWFQYLTSNGQKAEKEREREEPDRFNKGIPMKIWACLDLPFTKNSLSSFPFFHDRLFSILNLLPPLSTACLFRCPRSTGPTHGVWWPSWGSPCEWHSTEQSPQTEEQDQGSKELGNPQRKRPFRPRRSPDCPSHQTWGC